MSWPSANAARLRVSLRWPGVAVSTFSSSAVRRGEGVCGGGLAVGRHVHPWKQRSAEWVWPLMR
jgi:hypothetical protein